MTKELIKEIFTKGYEGSYEDIDNVVEEYSDKFIIPKKISKIEIIEDNNYPEPPMSLDSKLDPEETVKDVLEVWKDKDGEYHRYSEPAIKYRDGAYRWYKHGLIHRANGPAAKIIYTDRTVFEWWIDGFKRYSITVYYE